ncbi:MAG: methyltransferase domain-containing protein [Chitinophagaceae bacterium]|nr:methyltransferase domain-containing protein [Chitinophagaceae bacterium]
MSFFKLFIDHSKKDSFVNRLRKKRFSLLQQRIESLIEHKKPFKILDIGGDIRYWKHIGWKNSDCHIYLLNLFENKIDEADVGNFHAVVGNAVNLPFGPGEFDLVYSNSVIEHVGSYENQEKFAAEVKRVCDRYIIQTPSQWFPMEPHSMIPLFQFIPHKIRALLIMAFNINYFPKAKTYKEAVAVSRTTMMFTLKRFRKLFPDAEIYVEKLFGIPKSYTAIKL